MDSAHSYLQSMTRDDPISISNFSLRQKATKLMVESEKWSKTRLVFTKVHAKALLHALLLRLLPFYALFHYAVIYCFIIMMKKL